MPFNWSFCSKETSEVCHKILNWEKYLKIPSKIKISPEAEDLISKLINHPDIRLGINGVEEVLRSLPSAQPEPYREEDGE